MPLDREKFFVAAELPEPHHDGEDVRVVLQQRSPPHVLLDHLLALLVVGVVDDLLLRREFQLLQGDSLGRQRNQRPAIDLDLWQGQT